MSKAKENAFKKSDYELLFNDTPEYFAVSNAKMVFEGQFVRFICFDENNNYKEDHWYPIIKIHRIKKYS